MQPATYPCLADPDVWMQPATKPCGFKYYEYLLVYVDDILLISHRAKQVMEQIGKIYPLKDGFSAPATYLGAQILPFYFQDYPDKARWEIFTDKYVENYVETVEEELAKIGCKLSTRAHTPMSCFVDVDHAGDRFTCRSHTGILIFLNRAPTLWYSKRQNTVETSTLGSEFIAMKTVVEMIEGLRYKLRMMDIPNDGPCNGFCENESVCKKVTAPEST